jgi:hypothetical protein
MAATELEIAVRRVDVESLGVAEETDEGEGAKGEAADGVRERGAEFVARGVDEAEKEAEDERDVDEDDEEDEEDEEDEDEVEDGGKEVEEGREGEGVQVTGGAHATASR